MEDTCLYIYIGLTMEKLVRGNTESIGGLLETAGYSMVPSPTNKFIPAGARYYMGGYNMKRYD